MRVTNSKLAQKRPSGVGKRRGAALVEAALVVVVVVTSVLFLIDLCRYVAAKSALIRGTQQGLDLAIKLSDLDLSPFEAALSGGNPRFLASRSRVVQAATSLPLAALFQPSSATTSSLRLLRFTMLAPGHPLNSILSFNSDAILIRPGERYRAEDGYTANHPTAAFPQLALDLDFQNALYDHPLVVEMRGRFSFVTPLVPQVTLSARAIGFREISIKRNATAAPSPVSTGTTLVNPTYPVTTAYSSSSPTIPVTTIPTTTTTSTTIVCASPPPCVGFSGNVGVAVDASCNCSCKPGRVQVSSSPIVCVVSGE